MGQNELTKVVRNLKELMNMKAEIEAEIESAQDSIKAEMTAREVDELLVDVFKVRYTTVKSARFDATAFKKDYMGLYHQFCKDTVTRRFSVA